MSEAAVPLFPWTRWPVELEIPVGLVLILGGYLVALGPLRPRDAGGETVDARRVTSFVSGLLVLFVTLTGPLGDLAGTFLFSAHMVQHLVLSLVVPPLLLFGTPGWLLRPLILRGPLAPVARFVTRPPLAFTVFTVVLIAWHLPVLYNLALEDRAVHVTMHLMLIVSAGIGWWPLMSPLPELPRLSPPVQMLYITLLGMPMVVLAAFVTLADEVLFPRYAAAPRIWGLSPLDDQRIGGALMWVPGHLVFFVALTIVFFRWANAEPGPGVSPSNESRPDRDGTRA